MTWFNVDDSFHGHFKVWDAPDCAVALWTRAGSWVAGNKRDGFVPSGLCARFCSDPEAAVRELLDRGLWERADGGYRFHDWSDWNLTREQIDSKREAAAERQRRHRAAQRSGHAVSHAPVTRDSHVGHSTNPIQSNMVDLINQGTGSSDLDDDLILKTIIDLIHERAGCLISEARAAQIGSCLLTGRSTRDPVAYVRAAILAEPNVRQRFLTDDDLPPPQPPCVTCEDTRWVDTPDGKRAQRCPDCRKTQNGA